MYKSQRRSGVQLCYPFEERRLLESKFGWKWPVIVQPKLDGERCHPISHLLPDIHLISSECNPIISVPHINQAMLDQNINVELDGELYIHGMDFSEIHSIVSRKSIETIHPQAHLMQFHCFDVAWPDSMQVERIAFMPILEPPLFSVHCYICQSIKEIMYQYDRILEQGYEGIVVRELSASYTRKRSRFALKFKPKKTDDYEIVDCLPAFTETGEHKHMLGAFVCIGVDETKFKVGAGSLTHAQRIDIWKKYVIDPDYLKGKFCRVQYQNITNKGKVPRFGLVLRILE